MIKPIFLFFAFFIAAIEGWGQQVQITVNVLPPYSAYLQDYPGRGNQVQIFVRNTTTTALEVRFLGQITGDNGVKIATPPNFRPLQPLRLSPLESKLLTRNDLEGLFDLGQIEVQGVDKAQLYRGMPLPEGNYQLCIQAFDNRSSRALSANFPLGCSALFMVKSIEPPMLINPVCDSKVAYTTPQSVVFSWTPPVGVSPAQVSYTLRIIELPDAVDPNVFIDAVVLPPSGVEVKNLRTTSFLYGPNQPVLKVGKRYAVRVQAADPLRKINFLNEGKSPVCYFTYGEPKPLSNATVGTLADVKTDSLVVDKTLANNKPLPVKETPKPNIKPTEQKVMMGEAPPINCMTANAPTNKTLINGSINNKSLKLGEFELSIYQATQQGNGYSGEGRVKWNSAPIKVKFTGLQVNTDNQVVAGTVKSDDSGPGMPKLPDAQINPHAGLPNDYFDQVKTNLWEAAKQAASVPLPLKYETKLGMVGVNQMVFGPQGAEMDMVLGINVPEANLTLFLAATKVCMSPDKLMPNTGTLALVRDFPLPIPGGIGQKFIFKKNDLPKLNGTYTNIKNWEFEKVHGVMDLNLGSSLLKPDDGNGNLKGGDLVATVTADFEKWTDWFGIVALPPFQVPGVSGLTFKGVDVVYDHSDIANPDGFNPPAEFSGEKGPTFHGVYFKNLSVELPPSLKNDPRIGVSVKGGIVNGTGFTGLITPANKPILDYTKGQLGGFGFSIDDINILIVENGYKNGEMKGKIQLPISDDPLTYTTTLQGKFENVNFLVKPSSSGYKVPLFAADMSLNESTTIQVNYSPNQPTTIAMNLNGQVAINTSKFTSNKTVTGVADAILPKLYFNDFMVANQQMPGTTSVGGVYLSAGNWALTNNFAKNNPTPSKQGNGPAFGDDLEPMFEPPAEEENGNLRGFPVTFDPPKFVTVPNKGVGLEFGIGVHLGGEEKTIAAAKGTFQLLGNISTQNGRFKPVYQGINLKKLHLEGDLGPAKITGDLEFFNSDATYGDGFFGNASVELPAVGNGLKMKMLFGKKSYYYAYVDGTMLFSPGIPMVGPLMMNGFGGGILYNVKMQTSGVLPKPKDVEFKTTPDPGVTLSGIKYLPEKGAFGVKGRVIVGLVDPHVFAGLAEISAGFDNGGLNNLTLKGIASVLNTSGDPEKKDGVVNGEITMGYSKDENNQGSYDLNLDATGKFLTTTVTIPLRMHYGSSRWHVKIGDPYGERINVNLVNINTSFVTAKLDINGYVAVGNTLTKLPDIPKTVVDAFGKATVDNIRNKAFDNVGSMNNSGIQANAQGGADFGLMVGGSVNGKLSIQAMPFRLNAEAIVGFDAGIFKNMECSDGTKVVGYQGWYGNAQLFAYLKGGVDIYVDTWFFTGSVNIMSLSAKALFVGGLPNPSWGAGEVAIAGEALDGLISVSTSQSFSFGDKCVPTYAGDPLKNLVIISDIVPSSGSKGVSTRPKMAVAFNMPMNKEFKIALPTGSRMYIFRPQNPSLKATMEATIGGFKTTQEGPVSNTLLSEYKWANDKKAVYFEFVKYIPSYTKCELSMTVSVKEKVDKQELDPYIDSEKKRVARSETKTSTFTTGKQPTTIPMEEIELGWPIPNQHYFLKKEQKEGFIKGTFDGLETLNDSKMEYVAVFREPSGYRYEKPLKYNGNGLITFAIPNLKQQQSYKLELVKRPVTVYDKATLEGNGPGLTSTTYTDAGFKGVKFSKTALNSSVLEQSFEKSKSEFVLFSITFKTSKYNTFADKIKGIKLTAGSYTNQNFKASDAFLIPITTPIGAENFDDIELKGGKVYNTNYAPMIWMETPLSTTGFDMVMQKQVYDVAKKWAQDDNCPDMYSNNCKIQTITDVGVIDPKREYFQGGVFSTMGGLPTRAVSIVRDNSTSDFSGAILGKDEFEMPAAPGEPPVFLFERDRYMLQDMYALMKLMKEMRATNQKYVQWYLNDWKNLKNPDWSIVQKYLHDPTIADNDYPSYLNVSSKSASWMGTFYHGRYQKKQYWKTAEDPFYNLTNVDYDAYPTRMAKDAFTLKFNYHFRAKDKFGSGSTSNPDPLFKGSTLNLDFTIKK